MFICSQGYNGTILAYGQTGSGKTFTMQGSENSSDASSTANKVLLNYNDVNDGVNDANDGEVLKLHSHRDKNRMNVRGYIKGTTMYQTKTITTL